MYLIIEKDYANFMQFKLPEGSYFKNINVLSTLVTMMRKLKSYTLRMSQNSSHLGNRLINQISIFKQPQDELYFCPFGLKFYLLSKFHSQIINNICKENTQ